jgi:hypothetical protein
VKKGFFYNPFWRMGVFMWGGVFFWIFRILAIPIPVLKKIIYQYESGSIWAPLIIGSIGAFILETAILLIGRPHLVWNLMDIYSVFGLYFAGTLVGWLSLVKMRDYKNEED